MSTRNSKLNNLRYTIREYRRVLVAFSGGVDSTFLLKVCVDVIGNKNVIAVTAISDSFTRHEMKLVRSISKKLKVRHILLETNEMADSNFVANTPNRCYYCKKHLFAKLRETARKKNIENILDASNVDDEKDYRPGRRAARDFFIKSPLIEAEITKEDIRKYSRILGLDSWNKPANACLASRIPYGSKITGDKLQVIEKAETYMRNQGLEIVRVRHHGKLVRIEISKKEFKNLMEKSLRTRVIKYLKNMGFAWVTFDLEGYRMGSLNEILNH